MLYRRDLPLHAYAWVRQLYAAHAGRKGFVVEAFRGSSKTTAIAITWLAFRIGLKPEKSHLVIGASNPAARTTCHQVADLIAYNDGWKVAFPHVVPDKKRWGMQRGYDVKLDNMDYSQWRTLCAQEKGRDPTFIGFGYRADSIVGFHPTGMLIADDIHNERNTRSIKEMDRAVSIVLSNILPTLNPGSWRVFIGTPWRQGDILQYLKATENFTAVSTPVYTESNLPETDSSTSIKESTQPKAEQPDVGAGSPRPQPPPETNQTDPWTERELTWPQRFSIPVIEDYRNLVGEREFARMYLLDLSAAEGIHLKAEWLQKVDYSSVQPSWPVVMGVDYASTADKQRGNDRDYFAVAIGRALPSGSGIILIDGFRGHLSQAEAEDKLLDLVNFYPNTEVIGIETVAKGEEFYHLLSRRPELPIVQMNPGGESKGSRFQNAMAPLFERGWARTSDVESPFMQHFRREWLRWPWGDHDDTLDATYWMLRAGRYHLAPRSDKPKRSSPFSDLGRA